MTTTTTSADQRDSEAKEEEEEEESQRRRLGLVFDIDGTLIREATENDENDNDGNKILLRRGSMEFLHWCKEERGHSIALWTAASEEHLQNCLQVFCPLITNNHRQQCCGPKCRKTFDFAWSRSKLTQQTLHCTTASSAYYQGGGDDGGCRWCKSYRNSCIRCKCQFYTYACPCMYVKDLKKVWKSASQETQNFNSQRTLIIENTPQQCIRNYGNAIYVPTFYGQEQDDEPTERVLFQRMKQLILELEKVSNVRSYPKCKHTHNGYHHHQGGYRCSSIKPHACFHQDWLYYNDDHHRKDDDDDV